MNYNSLTLNSALSILFSRGEEAVKGLMVVRLFVHSFS